MKKGKLLILGLIALMLAGGLALASCTSECTSGDCGLDPSACSRGCAGSSGGGPYSPCSPNTCGN